MTFDSEEQKKLILEALMGVSYPGPVARLAVQTMDAVEKGEVVKPEADGKPEV